MPSGWGLELGTAIREARRSAGLAQADLAAALGVRQSSVSQWERGTTAPTTRRLLALLGFLGAVLVRPLVGEDGSSEESQVSSGAS